MGLFFAWALGEGIIVYRWLKNGAPPTPGALLLPSALFLGLAVLAEYQPARATATAFAYAVDLAILVQVVGKEPGQVTGWPPPALPDTQIWPGGTSTSTASTGATSTAAPGTDTTQIAAQAGIPSATSVSGIPGGIDFFKNLLP